MILKSDGKSVGKLICCFKNDNNVVNFDPSTRMSQNHRVVIFYDTEDWCKIWRKTDLWFGKWHEEFAKFSPEHLKVLKLELWWDPFVQRRKCMSLKSTEELCVMTLNNDAKFLREIDFSFQNWHEEFDKFWPEHSKMSNIFTLMGSFWPGYTMPELKKYRGVIFQNTEKWCKIWRKTDLWFRKWQGIWQIFTRTLKGPIIGSLMGFFYPK